jgi:hypothetical protein
MDNLKQGSLVKFKKNYKNRYHTIIFRVVQVIIKSDTTVYGLQPIQFNNPFYVFFMNQRELNEYCLFGPALDVLYGEG